MMHSETIRCPRCKAKMCLGCCLNNGHKLCAFCRPYPNGSSAYHVESGATK